MPPKLSVHRGCLPPNYDDIAAAFDLKSRGDDILFCYGGAIYTLSRREIMPPLFAHEGVHVRQHKIYGGSERWWVRYLRDPDFRAEQEIEAYRAQLAEFCRTMKDRNRRAVYASVLARDLASPMYGGAIDYRRALAAIRNTTS